LTAVKTISTILLVVTLGCAKAAPLPRENDMSNDTSQNTQSQSSEVEPQITTMSLTRAVPADEMPQFLQERIKRTPPVVTVADVRALSPDEREQVLKVVERARDYHLEDAQKYRNRGNPAERAAKDLAMFLNAARQ
jgi:hypothetical protein